MKNRLNIFSNERLNNFLSDFLYDYELFFLNFDDIENNLYKTQANIIIINTNRDFKFINFKYVNENYLIISNSKNNNLDIKNKLKILRAPLSSNQIRNSIKNFFQNLKIQFHDILINNEKLTNQKNNLFCYLTKVELEILSHLIREKETSKNFIKEKILNIKSNVETNSLESHLTRIRKKMNKVKTAVKIQTKGEKLAITV